MAEKLKVGVIGCGRIASSAHLPSYKNNPDCEIVYCCDIIKERAEEAAAKFGGKAVVDYNEVLNDKDVDVISVCTPNDSHSIIAIAALKAGKDVLCENCLLMHMHPAHNRPVFHKSFHDLTTC